MKRSLHNVTLAICTCLGLQALLAAEGLNDNYYINSTASWNAEGSSWTDAFTDLQVALDAAVPGDVHIRQRSPALDAGRNADVSAGTLTDLDGLPRSLIVTNGQASFVYIGLYEFNRSFQVYPINQSSIINHYSLIINHYSS